VETIHQALSGDARREQAAALLGQAIDQNRLEIERRWLARVQAEVVDRPSISLTQLRDGLPHYLVALVEQLRGSSDVDIEARSEAAWTKVARDHGVTRVRHGFDITQLIHEFMVLRHVIHDISEESGVAVDGTDAVLADVLDAAISAAVKAYVDARDYETRKKQAEQIAFLIHEFRNPLTTATMIATQLRRRAAPELKRLLEILDRSHKSLSDLIDGVLLTEKLEAGKIECHPVELRLGQIMESALQAARGVAVQKGLAFEASYDPDRQVQVDPLLTRSAIQNLADNAVKYTDRGHVEVMVEDDGGELIVHVRDTCQGLSAEELRTIFEPFERGATRKAGTGLGLAIARRAVEAQGGSIGAESPGQAGCHFWVRIPAAGRPKTQEH
jgi:signal transduction histidine kinase